MLPRITLVLFVQFGLSGPFGCDNLSPSRFVVEIQRYGYSADSSVVAKNIKFYPSQKKCKKMMKTCLQNFLL